MFHKIKIKSNKERYAKKLIDIFLDNKKLEGVTGLSLNCEVNEIPQLTLQMNTLDADIEMYANVKVVAPPEWIPTSKRLPHDRDWYLGIFREADTGWINPIPYICEYRKEISQYTTIDGWTLKGFTDGDEVIDYYRNLECVAWMQIPSYLGSEFIPQEYLEALIRSEEE